MFTLSYRGDDGAAHTREVLGVPGDGGTREIIIGRAPTCGLILNHPTVSRQHARVTMRGDRCFLTDLGSSYGTRVGGQRLAGEVELHVGDIFTIGTFEFVCGRRDDVVTPSAAALIANRSTLASPANAGLPTDLASPTPARPTPAHPTPAAAPAIPTVAPPLNPVSLSDDRQVIASSETIYRKVESLDEPKANAGAKPGDAARVIKLLSEIGKTLVTVQPLPQVLERVIDLVFESVAAERAFLLLRDSAYDALTPRVVRYSDGRAPDQAATLSRTVVNMVMRDRVAMLAADALNDARLDASNSIHQLNIRSFMCAPLWNRNEVIGVLYVDNPRSKKFSEDDLTVFASLSNYAAVAIEQARLADRLLEETRRRERLQRYHSPGVVNKILNSASGASTFETTVRDVTIMFTDIVGFTTMSEKMEPADVAATLNDFFREMTEVIFDHQGTLDKFIGDAILAVFGAPFEQADHALNAVQAAIAMRRVLRELNEARASATRPGGPAPPLNMRIAIHSGRALAGDIGSPKRREFTVLGDTVNTTSRLESSVAKPGQIVISKDTYDRLGGTIRATPLGPVTLRGRQSAIDVFAVEE